MDEHLRFHDKQAESIMFEKENFLDTTHTPLTEKEYEKYEKFCDLYRKHSISYSDFDIQIDRIVMYVNQEGEVLSNIQYCPFCGVKFILKR